MDVNQLSISLVSHDHEHMNIVLKGFKFMQVSTENDLVYYSTLDRLQIDNCYEPDPIFPVIIRPKCVAADFDHNH